MSSFPTMTIKGLSGKEYTFEVHDFDSNWNSVPAVYVVTKRVQKNDGKYSHSIIYIGQTEDLKARHSSHHKEDCFNRHGANRLCVLREASEKTRLAIESDLVQKHSPPCND